MLKFFIGKLKSYTIGNNPILNLIFKFCLHTAKISCSNHDEPIFLLAFNSGLNPIPGPNVR